MGRPLRYTGMLVISVCALPGLTAPARAQVDPQPVDQQSTYRMKGEWGSTAGSRLTGDGWTVSLAPGWVMRSGPRPVDYQVVREAR